MNAAERLAAHAVSADVRALSGETIAAIEAFTCDTLGVGVAGARAPYAETVRRLCAGWGGGADAHVWATGQALPQSAAAFVNAFQTHCLEYDCVHEGAVLHPFTVVVPALLAHAEAHGLDGDTYLAAAAAGVDVAVALGVAATTPIRFFRPATCGLFGAAAALARARGLTPAQATSALGFALAFAAGTMQAHVEGGPALALQVAAAARAASQAVDLAEAGLPGPRGALDGRYGYLTLFEAGFDLDRIWPALAERRRAAEVAFKPFPTGRAAHGGIDMMLRLRRDAGGPVPLEAVEFSVPPLIAQLVGRPIRSPLEVNEARLCLPFLAATAWLRGVVDLQSFAPDRLADPTVHALAAKVSIRINAVSDPAAFTPQRVTLRLADGRGLAADCAALPGGAQVPMSQAQQREKLAANLAFGFDAPRADLAEALTAACAALRASKDVGRLARLAAGLEPAP